ncbi:MULTISPECIES: type II toxin-antitoxin system RelE family toxin [unclassified Blastococcus]
MAAAVVDLLYDPLTEDPHSVGKPLRLQPEGSWSVRRRQDRVIYSMHDEVVVGVLRISHRADGYG